jgi:hypothetical protein
MPLDVVCPQCRSVHYETINNVFDPTVTVRPDMVRMKKPYSTEGWSGMSHDPGAGFGQMECLACEAPLAPNGRILVKDNGPATPSDLSAPPDFGKRVSSYTESHVCPKCGTAYKHGPSLYRHMRICNVEQSV